MIITGIFALFAACKAGSICSKSIGFIKIPSTFWSMNLYICSFCLSTSNSGSKVINVSLFFSTTFKISLLIIL